MKKGIVTIATRHPLYGRFAYNLAVSLRAVAPHIPITIIADAVGISHLDQMQLTVFDEIIFADQNDYYNDGKCTPLTLKYHLYKYSPYEATIFVDADTIFSPFANVDHVFSQLAGVAFTMANRGKQDPSKGISEWVEAGSVDVPYWYDLSSEFIYFEKGDKAMQVFTEALEAYQHSNLPTKMFAGDKPDEPFFMLGMIATGTHPHRTPFKPVFWHIQEQGFHSSIDVKKQWAMMSLGGKSIPKRIHDIYKEICHNVTYLSGYKTMTVSHKMNELPERKHI